MNHSDVPAYGLWGLVLLNSVLFIFFAFSFFKPKTKTDWRSFGAFSAFIVALFVEMYGFPLTIYLLSGWLQSAFPQTDILSHDAGHLWAVLLGFEGNPHLNPIHILANLMLFGGFWLLATSWRVLYDAQRGGTLATSGPYARVRHPQYGAFVIILLGFMLMWPTLLTLLMFPVLVAMYARLAVKEERDVRERFGDEWDRYAARTPRFLPRLAASRDDPGGPARRAS
ncbi:MAG TPA: isoprenylcysteine carboxyl methyltransferase [Myxococcales bacterium]|nr:isoprenylcysteine carboxyl methyltransferase [Myxococcales bacterium]